MAIAYVGSLYSLGTIPIRIAGPTVREFHVIRGDGAKTNGTGLLLDEVIQQHKGLPLDVSQGPARPDAVLLGSLLSPGLRLRRPVTLTVGTDDDLVTVCSTEYEELGFGSHLTDAIADFQRAFAELYRTLNAEQDRLGSSMWDTWQHVQMLIEEVP